jgi:hypothetical protein
MHALWETRCGPGPLGRRTAALRGLLLRSQALRRTASRVFPVFTASNTGGFVLNDIETKAPSMTLDEAVSAFETRVKFGDPKQIEALGVMDLAACVNRYFKHTGRSPICHQAACAARACQHYSLGHWDAAILEAQLARFRLLYHDGPELTAKQLQALERA